MKGALSVYVFRLECAILPSCSDSLIQLIHCRLDKAHQAFGYRVPGRVFAKVFSIFIQRCSGTFSVRLHFEFVCFVLSSVSQKKFETNGGYSNMVESEYESAIRIVFFRNL